ncbi:MAG TPA: hypothetical protein GX708_06195 [Gallicola sp.]|nr:hypothetical protein [Gallicola sp.]
MFYQKAQAVGITAGLAIKAMAVILSSMGVLHVVQNNGGIQSFFDSFTLFNHEGLNALRDMAINNIVHNVKIKANNVIASIREFFNSWADENLTVDEGFELGEGVKHFVNVTVNYDDFYYKNTWGDSTYFSPLYELYSDSNVTYEYDFRIRRRRTQMPGNEPNGHYIFVRLYANGQVVFNHDTQSSSTRLFGDITFNSNNTYQVQIEFTESSYTAKLSLTNYVSNVFQYGSRSSNFDTLIGLKDLHSISQDLQDIPQPQSLPKNGVDIAWDEASNKSISYIPEETKLEKLIEDIANSSVETFVENYTSWGKATTDSLTGPIITTETRVNQETGVEEQVVTDVTETVFDDIYEETHTQTGLLGSILGAITDLKDFIKSIFIPEEFNSLDFSPLQNIGIAEKFPFSLPWDLKNSVLALSANPEAPIFDVPIVSEVITLDFTEFESWASIIRVFTTLIFVIALIILTRRLI